MFHNLCNNGKGHPYQALMAGTAWDPIHRSCRSGPNDWAGENQSQKAQYIVLEFGAWIQSISGNSYGSDLPSTLIFLITPCIIHKDVTSSSCAWQGILNLHLGSPHLQFRYPGLGFPVSFTKKELIRSSVESDISPLQVMSFLDSHFRRLWIIIWQQ